MRVSTFLSIAAITLATTIGSVSAADQFATLDGVTANQMTSGELAAVKGMHIHFAIEGVDGPFTSPGGNPTFLVNKNSTRVDLGNGELVGPGYHGLCGAAIVSPVLSVPGPTGAGGAGC